MAGRNLVSLPPELQGMIFGLVNILFITTDCADQSLIQSQLPVSSLKSMRLVGKQCSAEVAKALWMEATIDIASPRPLKDLLAITTHGFVDSVKKLSIDTEYRGATLSRNRKLRQLLCGLSQNCLTTFRCVVFVVSQESLTILLGRQSHLSELLISADVDENLDHDLIQDTLDRLTSLHFESSISSHRDFRGIHILLKHAPGLRDLAISGHLKSWSMPPRSHLLNLRTLVLSNFHVEAPSVSAQAPFDMPHLEALELTHCSNVAALLQLLAEHNKDGSGYRCLERFTYRSFHAQEIEWDAVVKFLQSAKGLARAVLHSFVPNGRPLPIHHDLGPSVNTLRELQLTSCDPSRLPMWSVSDIESVATSCKTLERLVISLSDEDFSYRCIYHLHPLYISDIRDYTKLLVRNPTRGNICLVTDMF